MKLTARNIMVKDFDTIRLDAPIEDAVHLIYNGRARPTGQNTSSVMVTDEFGKLAGVISMFDVLYHLRPPVLDYMFGSRLSDKEIKSYIKHFKGSTVKQVMSSPVYYVSPDVDFMTIIDLMVRKKYRRLPVVENSRLIGVVYLSEVYYELCESWLKNES